MEGNVRDQVVEAGLLEHKVHVARSPAMPTEFLEKFANRTVVGYRVAITILDLSVS
jgi:hypothetical protein